MRKSHFLFTLPGELNFLACLCFKASTLFGLCFIYSLATPEKPTILECRFEELSWTQMSADVKFTLQYQEKDAGTPWQDVITTPDRSYSPSTNESFSNQKTYNFRLIAENCIGKSEPSDQCLVEGNVFYIFAILYSNYMSCTHYISTWNKTSATFGFMYS